MRTRSLVAFLGFGALTAAAGFIGNRATQKSVNSLWYKVALKKPPFQPPKQAFAPVWASLYAMIAGSGARVYAAPPSPERTRALTLWGAQLALNAGWSAIFFGARRPKWALAELGVLLATIGAYMHQAHKVDRAAAYLVAPYMGWSAFAALLNEEIVRRNPRFA
jgi:tryptophan-rich sensory protein